MTGGPRGDGRKPLSFCAAGFTIGRTQTGERHAASGNHRPPVRPDTIQRKRRRRKFGDNVHIDIIDRLPVPYGLIRFGVAPDHQSIKAVAKRYEKVALTDNVRFAGNVSVGKDVSIAQLQALYDAVILATGAPNDRLLDIPGSDLAHVYGSAAFVGWYNGHPDFVGLDPPLHGAHVVVVGNGNVALDVARILAKSETEFAGSDIVGHALAALKASSVEKDHAAGSPRTATRSR